MIGKDTTLTPQQRALYDAFKTVYERHMTDPLNHVNVVEWVDAAWPVVEEIVKDELTSALHPEFGYAWQEKEKDL